MRAHFLSLLASTAAVAVLAGCGGHDSGSAANAAPGTPANPLSGKLAETPNEAPGQAGKDTPGYQTLVDDQSREPQRRFTPCNLVTKAQARVFLGQPIVDPVEAPQGPTCIYRSKQGTDFITVAVQPLRLDRVRRRMTHARRVGVGGHEAFCGTYGQQMLYVGIANDRVLSIAGPCSVARRFAEAAAREFSA